LAAAIRNEFGVAANLEEGHGGIFEVKIDDAVVYSNRRQCSKLPTIEQIFQEVRRVGGAEK
jgi:predicted Rdx family selenoprotein